MKALKRPFYKRTIFLAYQTLPPAYRITNPHYLVIEKSVRCLGPRKQTADNSFHTRNPFNLTHSSTHEMSNTSANSKKKPFKFFKTGKIQSSKATLVRESAKLLTDSHTTHFNRFCLQKGGTITQKFSLRQAHCSLKCMRTKILLMDCEQNMIYFCEED